MTAAALVRRVPAPGRTAVAAVAAVVVLAGGYDVARGVPWDGMAPVRINWATPAEYRAIADGLPRGAVTGRTDATAGRYAAISCESPSEESPRT